MYATAASSSVSRPSASVSMDRTSKRVSSASSASSSSSPSSSSPASSLSASSVPSSRAATPAVFRLAGNRNQALKHLFSAYEYTSHSTGVPYDLDKNTSSATRQLRTAPEGATRYSVALKNSTTTKPSISTFVPPRPTRIYPDAHRGRTSLRARSLPSHFPTNVAHAEWMSSPYVDPSMRDTYRRVRSGGDDLKEWKGGAKPLELFEQDVRGLDPDFSHADKLAGAGGAQIQHPAPFLGGAAAKVYVLRVVCAYPYRRSFSVPRSRTHERTNARARMSCASPTLRSAWDKSAVSGAERYVYKYAPYEQHELALQCRQDAGRHLCAGFRPDCDHIHYAFKRSGPAGLTPTETDRNPQFESVRAPDEHCYHFRRGY